MSVFPIDSKQRFEYMKYICAYDSFIKVAKEILLFCQTEISSGAVNP